MAIRVTDLRNGHRDYTGLDDRMLVLDFQAGDPEAFVEIHNRYGGLARQVCQRFLPNRPDADEAHQETMIRVFQGLHRFNGRYALQPWIARIATNVSLDIIRGRARRPREDVAEVDALDHWDPDDTPEKAYEGLVQRDLVLSVLTDLPENHRTALVLRELEGRSHKEIAERMGISSGQAKALIHRAKGSFRRGWLLAITQKGGLAGIAILPLLWLAKVGEFLRRFADRTGQATQVAQAATPEVVTAAASSPAVSIAASGIGERVVAAGMTLLVAGSVTVGAVAIKHRQREEPPPAAAPATVPTVLPPVEEEVIPTRTTAPEPPARSQDQKKQNEGKPVAVSPAPEASPEPPVTPSPSPTVEPTVSPAPGPTEPPPIPPAPPWSLKFGSSVPLGQGAFEQISSRVNGKPGQELVFSQTVAAPRFDAEGNQVGRVYLEYWGGANGDSGSVDLWLFVDTPAGRYRFDAGGGLAAMVSSSDGPVTYVFSGTYSLAEQPPLPEDGSVAEALALHNGAFQLKLSFWADGKSLYKAGLQLTETPAPAE